MKIVILSYLNKYSSNWALQWVHDWSWSHIYLEQAILTHTYRDISLVGVRLKKPTTVLAGNLKLNPVHSSGLFLHVSLPLCNSYSIVLVLLPMPGGTIPSLYILQEMSKNNEKWEEVLKVLSKACCGSNLCLAEVNKISDTTVLPRGFGLQVRW